MKVVVTGGAGFIGSHAVDRLLELGHEVVVIDDFSYGKEENLQQHKNNPKLAIHKKDINEKITDILKGTDAILHFAAIPRVQYSIEHPDICHHANVNGTLNLLIEAKNSGVKRFVFISSCAVYGDNEKIPYTEETPLNPLSPYAAHKITGEHYTTLFNYLHGMETVNLRFFNVYGPRLDPSGSYACLVPRSIDRAIQGLPIIIYGDGEQTRDFVYVSDIIDAVISAAFTKSKESIGQTFNIGTGKETSVNDVIKHVLEMQKTTVDHHESRKEPRKAVADITKAKKLLGWTPKTTLKEGLKQTFNYLKANAKS